MTPQQSELTCVGGAYMLKVKGLGSGKIRMLTSAYALSWFEGLFAIRNK